MLFRVLFDVLCAAKLCKDNRASGVYVAFTNWEDSTTTILNYGSRNFHRACADSLISTVDIEDMLNKQAVTDK